MYNAILVYFDVMNSEICLKFYAHLFIRRHIYLGPGALKFLDACSPDSSEWKLYLHAVAST